MPTYFSGLEATIHGIIEMRENCSEAMIGRVDKVSKCFGDISGYVCPEEIPDEIDDDDDDTKMCKVDECLAPIFPFFSSVGLSTLDCR